MFIVFIYKAIFIMIYKILITGANGQLGYELQQLLSKNVNYELFFTDIDSLDITDPDAVNDFFKNINLDFIINAAAYTAVDKAEIEKDIAEKVNVTAVKNLALCAKNYNAKMIHISTDYVYDGNKSSPYVESDSTNPLGYYGYSKLLGEREMLNIAPKGVIIRTSWLYSTHGNNFVKTIINKALNDNQNLKVVYDQIGTPTYARDLANCINLLIKNFDFNQTEIFHFSNEGVASWYDFAYAILKIIKVDKKIIPIETHQIQQLAERPKYSVMSKNKIKSTLNVTIPHWCDSLIDMINHLK